MRDGQAPGGFGVSRAEIQWLGHSESGEVSLGLHGGRHLHDT